MFVIINVICENVMSGLQNVDFCASNTLIRAVLHTYVRTYVCMYVCVCPYKQHNGRESHIVEVALIQ